MSQTNPPNRSLILTLPFPRSHRTPSSDCMSFPCFRYGTRILHKNNNITIRPFLYDHPIVHILNRFIPTFNFRRRVIHPVQGRYYSFGSSITMLLFIFIARCRHRLKNTSRRRRLYGTALHARVRLWPTCYHTLSPSGLVFECWPVYRS